MGDDCRHQVRPHLLSRTIAPPLLCYPVSPFLWALTVAPPAESGAATQAHAVSLCVFSLLLGTDHTHGSITVFNILAIVARRDWRVYLLTFAQMS